jgi:hypothetical protein
LRDKVPKLVLAVVMPEKPVAELEVIFPIDDPTELALTCKPFMVKASNAFVFVPVMVIVNAELVSDEEETSVILLPLVNP